MTTYSERLTAPLSWWLSATAFAAVWGWIMLVATTAPIAIATTAVLATLCLAAVWSYGSLRIDVGDDGLTVGRATLRPPHIGAAERLGRADYRRRLGTGADARAYLVTRPYIESGVLVEVADDRDPVPYWLLSSRRPEALAAALAQNGQVPRVTEHETIQEAARGEEG